MHDAIHDEFKFYCSKHNIKLNDARLKVQLLEGIYDLWSEDAYDDCLAGTMLNNIACRLSNSNFVAKLYLLYQAAKISENDSDVGLIITNIAAVYQSNGYNAKAEELYKVAFTMLKEREVDVDVLTNVSKHIDDFETFSRYIDEFKAHHMSQVKFGAYSREEFEIYNCFLNDKDFLDEALARVANKASQDLWTHKCWNWPGFSTEILGWTPFCWLGEGGTKGYVTESYLKEQLETQFKDRGGCAEERLEFTKMLMLEAINLGCIAGGKCGLKAGGVTSKCQEEFIKLYSETVQDMSKVHPEFFVEDTVQAVLVGDISGYDH